MRITKLIGDGYEFMKRRIFLISWISLVVYVFYTTFICYNQGRQFYYLRRILGLGLCISRATASVLNLCCALVLLPLCKKLNQILYRILSRLWPRLFILWLEKAKSFHMTVAITLLLFAVIHSLSHFVNLWNFSRGYDEDRSEINFANYRNENPLLLLMTIAGVSGISMLLITVTMGLTSMRVVRRKMYNAFWYTHHLYLLFMVLLLIHPLSGVLKEEVIDDIDTSLHPSQEGYWRDNSTLYSPKFVAIQSRTWCWMAFPLTWFFLDLLWRIFSRNCARVKILQVTHMAGGTISLTLSCPHEEFTCSMGQYVLLQCLDVSLLEWHPFTVVKIPTSSQREIVVWIRVKGDWTEALQNLLLEKEAHNISMLLDGPFSSPMEGVSRSKVCVCVAAGVGITPFVPLLHHMLLNPRSSSPKRIHLLWIVRNEDEITWLADLANLTILQLRNANRPDRLHLELYVTNTKENEHKNDDTKVQNSLSHVVVVNDTGLTHILAKKQKSDDDRTTLLTPNKRRNVDNKKIINANKDSRKSVYDIAKKYPLLGCRVRRGRPHWDRVFGYWIHSYPEAHLNLYCCGPKNLVKLLRNKCKCVSRSTKTKFTFVHEGFS